MAKMHENEYEIDKSLVLQLLKNQCPQWSVLPITQIKSSGTENALFRLGNEYVIRFPRVEWNPGSINEKIMKEYTWLPKIAVALKIPISKPIFKGSPDKSYPWPWIITKWIEGHNPVFEVKNEYELLADDLACFVNELHDIKLTKGEPISRRGIPLKTGALEEETKNAICELKEEIDVEPITCLWNRLSNVPYWSNEPVWIHGDLLPDNILIENNRLSGVIDFSDLGIGDPSCDLVIAWSLFNNHSRNIFRERLKNIDENTWERGRGWALSIAVIMLPYYKHTNPVMARLARRMIDNVLSH